MLRRVLRVGDQLEKSKLNTRKLPDTPYCHMEQTALDKALKLGGTYYRSENYGRALELFRRCLLLAKSYPEQELVRLRNQMGLPKHNSPRSDTVYHPKYTLLLESVAACYEKSLEYSKALEYTQKLIKIEPFNVKAYMRLQRLLQRQGKLEAAFSACKRGISTAKKFEQSYGVPVSRRHVELLKRSKICIGEKLTLKNPSEQRRVLQPENKHGIEPDGPQSPKKRQRAILGAFDFISRLPPELLPMILHGFSSKELLEVMLVCKRWYHYIYRQPQLFQMFVLSNRTYRQISKFCDFARKVRSRHGSIDLIKYSARLVVDEMRSLEALFTNLQGYRCRRFVLSVPHCTTIHLSQYMSQNVELCQSLQELSLVISLRADKPYNELRMLSHCENLKRFEIVVNSSMVSMAGGSPGIAQNLPLDEATSLTMWSANLESLSICCDNARVDQFPFYALISHFPSNKLQKLCIAGATFTQLTNQFDWLVNFRHLKEIWLENNKGATLQALLHLLKDCPLTDMLKKFTFREYSTSSRFDLESPAENYFYYHNFQNLHSLDLMGSSISGLGLLRLVSYTQPSKIRVLNIGDCPYIRLDKYQHVNDTSSLPSSAFFTRFPELQELIMPQFGILDDNSMKLLIAEAPNWHYLQKLDLSLNPTITGVSIYELLRALWRARGFPLELLTIDGCPSVSHITVNMIRAQGLAKQVNCAYERDTWHRVGVNSLKYRVTT